MGSTGKKKRGGSIHVVKNGAAGSVVMQVDTALQDVWHVLVVRGLADLVSLGRLACCSRALRTDVERATTLWESTCMNMTKQGLRLTATLAMRMLCLTRDELRAAPFKVVDVKRGRYGITMHLYDPVTAWRLVGGAHDLHAARLARLGRQAKLTATKRRRVDERAHHQEELRRTEGARRAELTAALHDRGVQLRSDSKLCCAYISSAIGSAELIANRMLEMQWIYANEERARCYGDMVRFVREDSPPARRVWHRRARSQKERAMREEIEWEDMACDEAARHVATDLADATMPASLKRLVDTGARDPIA